MKERKVLSGKCMKVWRIYNNNELVYGVVIAETLEEAKYKWEKRMEDYDLSYINSGEEFIEWNENDDTNGVLLFD